MKKLTLTLFLIGVVASACNVSKVAGVKSTGPSDPKADVVQASQKLIALKSLTGKVEATGETAYSKQVQYAAPGLYHLKYHDDSGADMEMVMNESRAFIKSGDTWSKLPGDESP